MNLCNKFTQIALAIGNNKCLLLQGADNPSSLMMSMDPNMKQEKDGQIDNQDGSFYGKSGLSPF